MFEATGLDAFTRKCIGQKRDKPGDQGHSQDMAENTGSGEGGSPSEQEEMIQWILVF